jgi:16S rRNA (cytidine1402-2'-O)-methyltransferase
VALVSDAGTPGISDPGYNLIKLAVENDVPVTAIPGPTALITALVLSGKPAHSFFYEGFLPVKPIKRKNRLRELKGLKSTLVIYESPHRLIKTLSDIGEIFPEREVAVLRELTKKFEEIKREKPDRLIKYFADHKPRGEFVIVI